MRRTAAVVVLSLLTACSGSKQQPTDSAPTEPDPTSTVSPLLAACEAGTARSCLIAANESEVNGDTAEAARLYDAACALEESSGCALAGGLLAESGELDAALSAFDAGCALDDGTSCYGKGLVVAGSFGGEPDFAAAVPAFQRGCELGLAASCGDLAGLYREGQGVEVDLERADALRTRACDGGDGESCMHLGLAAWKADDRDKARALFERSCANELPDPTGCGYYGWILWSDEDGGEPARGIALMDSSCEAGSAVGCSLRAATFASMGDTTSGDALLKQACELDAANCEQFSAQYQAAQDADSTE